MSDNLIYFLHGDNAFAVGGLYLLVLGCLMHLLAIVIAKPDAMRKAISLGGAGISCGCLGAFLLGLAVGIESVLITLIITAPCTLTEIFAAIHDRGERRGATNDRANS